MSVVKLQNTQSELFPTAGAPHRQVTISTTAVDLVNSVTLNPKTSHVLIQFVGATARVTLDGTTTPTATIGFQYATGSSALISRSGFPLMLAIREASTDVVAVIQEMNFA